MRRFIPKSIARKSDPEKFSIEAFICEVASSLPEGILVLDAGSGKQPYRKYFSHLSYEGTDFEDIFDSDSRKVQDFVCSLDDIPKEENTYDVVINTQVLEHVPDPQKVIRELYRILKPGGSLYVTAPQGWGVHGAPYHYFNFTNHGLELLFNNAGFDVQYINPRGGYFWYLAKRIRTLPSTICPQHYDNSKGYRRFLARATYKLVYPWLEYLVPYVLFHLDSLDKEKSYTLGYSCHCVKPKQATEGST